MKKTKQNHSLIPAVIFYLICVFQIVTEPRYLERFPYDKLAIVLYAVTIALCAIIGTVFTFQWLNWKKSSKC